MRAFQSKTPPRRSTDESHADPGRTFRLFPPSRRPRKRKARRPPFMRQSQVLAARKAAEARGKASGPNTASPPRAIVVPKSPQEALASDLPRGSLLDIVI